MAGVSKYSLYINGENSDLFTYQYLTFICSNLMHFALSKQVLTQPFTNYRKSDQSS